MSDAASETATDEGDLEALLDDADESIDRLEEQFGDLEDLEEGIGGIADRLGEGELKSTLEDLEKLVAVAAEVEELLETIDLSELPDAIDEEDVLEAIHVGEIPDALAEGETDDVVNLRRLIRAVNLTELWDATDLRHFWGEKAELEEAVDDLMDGNDDNDGSDDDDESVVGEAVDTATDALGGDDDEEGTIEGAVDDLEEGAVAAFGSAEQALEDGNLSEYETIIQQQAMEGIDEFRAALIETHGTFQQLYEYNREKMGRTDKETHSRNPTAVSTMSIERSDMGGTAGKHSTVPQQVKYSTAPSRKRIYGQRFEQELEKRREELREKRDEHRAQQGESE